MFINQLRWRGCVIISFDSTFRKRFNEERVFLKIFLIQLNIKEHKEGWKLQLGGRFERLSNLIFKVKKRCHAKRRGRLKRPLRREMRALNEFQIAKPVDYSSLSRIKYSCIESVAIKSFLANIAKCSFIRTAVLLAGCSLTIN